MLIESVSLSRLAEREVVVVVDIAMPRWVGAWRRKRMSSWVPP